MTPDAKLCLIGIGLVVFLVIIIGLVIKNDKPEESSVEYVGSGQDVYIVPKSDDTNDQ